MPLEKPISFIWPLSFKNNLYFFLKSISLQIFKLKQLTLKYTNKKERVITGLKRISKPGLRVYAKNDEIPQVLNGLGIAIISTSKGIMTDKQARKENIGGEVLAYIW